MRCGPSFASSAPPPIECCITSLPWTGLFFLVGCISISALPPFNGFVSEWLTFQAILQSPELPQWGLKILVPAVGGLLALAIAWPVTLVLRQFMPARLSLPLVGLALLVSLAGFGLLAPGRIVRSR